MSKYSKKSVRIFLKVFKFILKFSINNTLFAFEIILKIIILIVFIYNIALTFKNFEIFFIEQKCGHIEYLLLQQTHFCQFLTFCNYLIYEFANKQRIIDYFYI